MCVCVGGGYLHLKKIVFYGFSSLSVGHSRRHVGGPTNWDIA